MSARTASLAELTALAALTALTALTAFMALTALAACADGGDPPECVVDEDCGFESELCRDGVCVARDTTLHAECCACLADNDCLLGGLTAAGCSDNLDRAQPIDVDATCVDDEARCATACDFLSLP